MNNKMRGARYWEAKEKRRCMMCGEDEEIWEHVLEERMDREEGENWWKRRSELLEQEEDGEW